MEPQARFDEDAGRMIRPNADATLEIRAEDVIEAIDVRPSARTRTTSRSDEGASIAPVALEIYSRDYAFGPEESLSGSLRIRLRRRPPPNPRLVATVGAAVALCIVILMAAGLRTALTPKEEAFVGTASAPKTATSAAGANGGVNVDNLPPAPTSGTVVFPKRSVVTLDGARVTSGSAIVKCGDHTLRVGRGSARKIDVPCGGTLDLAKH